MAGFSYRQFKNPSNTIPLRLPKLFRAGGLGWEIWANNGNVGIVYLSADAQDQATVVASGFALPQNQRVIVSDVDFLSEYVLAVANANDGITIRPLSAEGVVQTTVKPL